MHEYMCAYCSAHVYGMQEEPHGNQGRETGNNWGRTYIIGSHYHDSQ